MRSNFVMEFTLYLIAAVSAVYRGEPEVYIAHVRGKVRTIEKHYQNKQTIYPTLPLPDDIFNCLRLLGGKGDFNTSFFWDNQWLKDGTGSIF